MLPAPLSSRDGAVLPGTGKPRLGGYQMLFGVNNVGDKTFYVSGDSNRTCCFDVRAPGRKRNWFVSVIKEF